MKKLTVKEEKFAQLVVELGNQSEAYRQAYNPTDANADWVTIKASQLLTKDNIKIRVEEIKNKLAMKHDISKDFIVNGLLEIINDADYTFKLGKDNKLSTEDRKAFYRIKEQTKNSDKLKALEQLTKMLGFNEPEKVEQTVRTIEIIEKKRL